MRPLSFILTRTCDRLMVLIMIVDGLMSCGNEVYLLCKGDSAIVDDFVIRGGY